MTGYGCNVSSANSCTSVTPTDGVFKRLNMISQKLSFSLNRDRYTGATVSSANNYLGFTLQNQTGDAHTTTLTVVGLAAGTYPVSVGGTSAASVTAASGKPTVISLSVGTAATSAVLIGIGLRQLGRRRRRQRAAPAARPARGGTTGTGGTTTGAGGTTGTGGVTGTGGSAPGRAARPAPAAAPPATGGTTTTGTGGTTGAGGASATGGATGTGAGGANGTGGTTGTGTGGNATGEGGTAAPARPDRAAAPAPPRPMPRAVRGRRCSASRWASPRCGAEAAEIAPQLELRAGDGFRGFPRAEVSKYDLK